MVLPTTATLNVDCDAFGDSPTNLASSMDPSLAPVDAGYLILFSSRVSSDGTSHNASTATRTTAINLTTPPFVATIYNEPRDADTNTPIGFQLSVESTSDEDSASGGGVHVITVTYDSTSGPGSTEDITMTGKTPALSSAKDVNKITDVTFKTVGTFAQNRGVLIFRSVPVPPTPANNFVRSVPANIVGSMLEGYFNNIGYLSGQIGQPWANFLKVPLQQLVSSVRVRVPHIT